MLPVIAWKLPNRDSDFVYVIAWLLENGRRKQQEISGDAEDDCGYLDALSVCRVPFSNSFYHYDARRCLEAAAEASLVNGCRCVGGRGPLYGTA